MKVIDYDYLNQFIEYISAVLSIAVKGRGWSRLCILSDFGSFPNPICLIPCIHIQKCFYKLFIVDAQYQELSASPTSIFPYKLCKVLFGFSRLSQHWIFSVDATLGTLFKKHYIS